MARENGTRLPNLTEYGKAARRYGAVAFVGVALAGGGTACAGKGVPRTPPLEIGYHRGCNSYPFVWGAVKDGPNKTALGIDCGDSSIDIAVVDNNPQGQPTTKLAGEIFQDLPEHGKDIIAQVPLKDDSGTVNVTIKRIGAGGTIDADFAPLQTPSALVEEGCEEKPFVHSRVEKAPNLLAEAAHCGPTDAVVVVDRTELDKAISAVQLPPDQNPPLRMRVNQGYVDITLTRKPLSLKGTFKTS